MGKLLIGSNLNDVNYLNKIFTQCGFKASGNYKNSSIYIYVYKKLRINTNNFVEFDDGFIIGTGTYIYNNKIDKEALSDIYIDFKKHGLVNIRNKIIGSFAILINMGEEIYLFVDNNNTYDLYYYLANEEVLITNTYWHIFKVKHTDIDEVRMIERTFLNSNLGSATPYKEIKKLLGNEYIYGNKNNWVLKNFNCESTKTTYCLDNLWLQIKKDYAFLDSLYKRSGICMTGGQDSRINLAILLSEGMKPICYYGEGNSIMTWTKEEDLKIVRSIAEKEKLEVKLMNWHDINLSSFKLKELLYKYGELVTIYGCNFNFINEFECNIDVDFLSFGYFGEVFRNVETIENYPNEEYTLKEFIDNMYIRKDLKLFYRKYDVLRETIYKEMLEICKKKNIDPMLLKKADFQKINTEYRKSADIVLNNFANIFFYSFPFLANKKYTDASETIDYSEKSNAKLILEGFKMLSPELLDINFFSHVKKKKYNKGKNELVDNKFMFENLKEKLKNKTNNEKLLNILRKAYRIILKDKKGYIELDNNFTEKKKMYDLLKKSGINDILDLDKMVNNCDLRVLKNIYMRYYITELAKEIE